MDDLHHLHPHGVFLRREFLAAGYDDKLLYQSLRRGELSRVRYGAYVASDSWRAADEVRRNVLRAHAVGLSHEVPFAISHVTGALLHGVDTWGMPLDRVHVTRADPANGLRTANVTYHLGQMRRLHAVEGTPVLSPAACVVGAALVSSVEAGVVALDSAYAKGQCTPHDVQAAYRAMCRHPGAARLQVTMRLAEPGSESVGESRARYLMFRHGIPKPLLQYAVQAGGELLGTTDFAWPAHRLLGEFDGRIKYGRLLRPGETTEDAVYREKVREDRIREATGWTMIRLSWSDLSTPYETAERIRRALRAGSSRT